MPGTPKKKIVIALLPLAVVTLRLATVGSEFHTHFEGISNLTRASGSNERFN